MRYLVSYSLHRADGGIVYEGDGTIELAYDPRETFNPANGGIGTQLIGDVVDAIRTHRTLPGGHLAQSGGYWRIKSVSAA